MTWAEQTLAQMTLEEKVGQLLMVGFEGEAPSPQVVERITKQGVGGIILFARNMTGPEQVTALNRALQETAAQTRLKIPLLISADQEGGVVVRITDGAAVMPGNMALGATRSPEAAYQAGQVMGAEMRAMGLNMNLAPVLDVNSNPHNPGIGSRSISEDPHLVAELGAELIKGMQEAGCVATAKHAPGKGEASLDSHLALPVINKTVEELRALEYVPFVKAVQAGVDALMTSHCVYPAVEPEPGLPATLSHAMLTGVLREEMGFDGIIITDDMEMKAISAKYDTAEAAVLSFLAGADILLSCHIAERQEATYNALLEAARSGRITPERLDQSVLRILKLKERRGLVGAPLPSVEGLATTVGTPEHLEIAAKIAEASITVVRDNDGLLPLKAERLLVVTPQVASLTGAEDITSAMPLIHAVRRRQPGAAGYVTDVNPTAEQIEKAVALAAEAEAIVVGTYNGHLNLEQPKLVEALRATGKPLVVVAMRNPYDLIRFAEVGTYVCAYSHREVSLEAAVKVIFGEVEAKGRLPVHLPGITEYQR